MPQITTIGSLTFGTNAPIKNIPSLGFIFTSNANTFSQGRQIAHGGGLVISTMGVVGVLMPQARTVFVKGQPVSAVGDMFVGPYWGFVLNTVGKQDLFTAK